MQVEGTVSEVFGDTRSRRRPPGRWSITNAGNNLAQVTPATIDLPITGAVDEFYEKLEGMRRHLRRHTDVSGVVRAGAVRPDRPVRRRTAAAVHGGQPRRASPACRAPRHSDRGARSSSMTTTTSRTRSLDAPGWHPVRLPSAANGGFSVGTQGTDFVRGGDLVNSLTGVLHWSSPGIGTDAWRLRPPGDPTTFTVANPRPATPPAVGGAISAASVNLLNYFTTIDTTVRAASGPCGPSARPTVRGADSVAELNRQRERLDRDLRAQRRCRRPDWAREHHRDRHDHRPARCRQHALRRRASVHIRQHRRHARHR